MKFSYIDADIAGAGRRDAWRLDTDRGKMLWRTDYSPSDLDFSQDPAYPSSWYSDQHSVVAYRTSAQLGQLLVVAGQLAMAQPVVQAMVRITGIAQRGGLV
jgi:hypothetical protein